MPERCWIHSSEVVIRFSRSKLVTMRGGTKCPVAVMIVRMFMGLLGDAAHYNEGKKEM